MSGHAPKKGALQSPLSVSSGLGCGVAVKPAGDTCLGLFRGVPEQVRGILCAQSPNSGTNRRRRSWVVLLKSAHVTNFKSIEDSDEVAIDAAVTVLVGQNESGKTAFLQALNKARSVDGDEKFVIFEDYPRRLVTQYQARHEVDPDVAVVLTYELEADDLAAINEWAGFRMLEKLEFTSTHKYNNIFYLNISVPEGAFVQYRVEIAGLAAEVKAEALKAPTLAALIRTLDRLSLNPDDEAFRESLKIEFPARETWSSLNWYLWQNFISERIPKFLYFDDYYLLPGKVSLVDLQQRVQGTAGKTLREEDKTALSLLRLAGVELNDLTETTGYEPIKARLEGISISITDKLFEYWTQNRELDVEFDIRQDPKDEPPFNQGNNLYIRIRNRRHRMSVPFSQRSKGFIWFFSFITWFDSIQQQIDAESGLILLLDEPGLSLHAMAQADFLRYIDDLSNDHQVLYTTHSPFMVHSDRLDEVRTVEDKRQEGTKITSNISGADPNTIFPLQAALGYTVAQNLFISKHNLLVEGPADLVYLRYFSAALDALGRAVLAEHITIVPVGGLDKLATFVALLRGNELELAVLHDYDSKPDRRLEDLVREKLIRDRQVLNYAMFRAAAKIGGSAPTNLVSSDVEDLFLPSTYLTLFNAAYKHELGGATIKVSDLPRCDRIVQSIRQYLDSNGIQLRPSGGFNHYLVANHLAANPIKLPKSDTATLGNFEAVFRSVNQLLPADSRAITATKIP